jgi:hypothetical protein
LAGKREDSEFLKNFISGEKHLLIDLTQVFSLSKEIILAEKGDNNKFNFVPPINLLFIFSFDPKMPLFYRLLPGVCGM